MIAGLLAELVVKEKEVANLQLDQLDTIWSVMLDSPRETEFPLTFYKSYKFDDQQVMRTQDQGNDRVQDVTNINIGTGGDGKDILLGDDGNHVATGDYGNIVATGDDGNHVATDGNDLDAASAGDPENCDQVVARFRDADVTVFPTYFNGMCLWFLKVILAVLNLKKKLIKNTFKTIFFHDWNTELLNIKDHCIIEKVCFPIANVFLLNK